MLLTMHESEYLCIHSADHNMRREYELNPPRLFKGVRWIMYFEVHTYLTEVHSLRGTTIITV